MERSTEAVWTGPPPETLPKGADEHVVTAWRLWAYHNDYRPIWDTRVGP